MKNIKIVQASFITRKVQQSNKPWKEVIAEEVEKLKRGEDNALRIYK